MNKQTFYIIRHGEKVKTPGDPPLSDKGNEQANLLAHYLHSFPITKLVTSPILRTQQTARYIADKLGIDVEINDLLKERVNWGDDPKQSFEEFLAMWQKSSQERKWQPPVGDSSHVAGQRLQQVIESFSNNEHEHIVLVTHGGIITDFLRNTFSIDELSHLIPDFDTTLDTNIKECSITIVEKDLKNSKLHLVKIADVDHLH